MTRMSFALIVIFATLFSAASNASERMDFYLEMQQREECKALGGRYDENKCYLPDSTKSSRQAGPVWVKNPHNCPIMVAVAYVKPGGKTYTIDGWWEVGPTYWSGYKLEDAKGRLMMHDGTRPLYFAVKRKEDGERPKRLSRDIKFTFDGKSYDFTKSTWYEKGFWVAAHC